MGTIESAGQAPQLRAAAVSRLLDLIRHESGDARQAPLRNGARGNRLAPKAPQAHKMKAFTVSKAVQPPC